MNFSWLVNDTQRIGLVGCVFFSLFGLLCIIQAYRLQVNINKLHLNLQLLFFIISFLAASFEALYFLMMAIHDRYTTLGYIFHMLGMFSSSMAFIAVVFRWNKVLQLYSKSSALLGMTHLLIGGNVVVTLIAIIDSSRINEYDEYIKHWSYEAVAISNCLTIFIYSLGVFFCAHYVRSKLIVSCSSTPTYEGENNYSHRHSYNISTLMDNEEGRAQLLIKLRRMNLALGFCSLCYFLRVVCVISVVLDVERDKTTTDSIAIFWWFTLSLWIPSLGSGSILLYTMRPMQSSQEEFQQARRLWPRYMAHSSDPSSSSCPSCSTGSRLLSSYLPGDSTDSSFGEDDYNFDELTNSPLLSDDYGDIAFEYEADEHQKRYRKESLSTGTLGTHGQD